MAEIRLADPGGDNQVVVLAVVFLVGVAPMDHPGLGVDVVDQALQHRDIALEAQHLAGGRGDVAAGEDPGRHLVQQRLEEMAVGPVQQRDREIRLTA